MNYKETDTQGTIEQEMNENSPRLLDGNLEQSESRQDMFTDMLLLSDQYLHKKYLQNLSQLQIVSPQNELMDIEPGSNLRLIQLDTVLCDKDTKISQVVKNLFGAVETYDASVMLIINGKGDRVELYLGISSDSVSKINSSYAAFMTCLSGMLPGCKYRQLIGDKKRQLLCEIFPCLLNPQNPEPHAVSCIPALPVMGNVKADGKNMNPYEAIAKLDVLVEGMRSNPFSMVLLAKSISESALTETQQMLELIYSQISPYERIQFTTSENDTDSLTLNYNQSVNTNKSYSAGFTHGTSHTHGTSKSIATPEGDTKTAKGQAAAGLVATAATLALNLAAASAPAVVKAIKVGKTSLTKAQFAKDMMADLFYSSSISTALNNVGVLNGANPRPMDKTITESEHDDYSDSDSKQITFSTSEGTSESQGYNIGSSKGTGSSTQITHTNKMISSLLWELDRELDQIRRLKREGAFLGAAYFIAGEEEVAVTAANLYRAITQSGGEYELRSPINMWENTDKLSSLTNYLCRGEHPLFFLENWGTTVVEAAQFVSLSDLPVYFSLPERSIPGYIYEDYARFSRDIIYNNAAIQKDFESDQQKYKMVNIGHIYHLGRVEEHTPIRLSVDDLTKHLFVTGATGVGKSNFCYHLLDQLMEKGIHTLVIEPAKGEYATVFGGKSGIHVFGTDPNYSPLLRINPFSFPNGISAVQHIERLLDIFNAAWPMYSAMPAILKEAIEEIYVERGFDLVYGMNQHECGFPSFSDLLNVLPRIIEKSAYSSEVKGNYTGALVTRVKSLTNGIYGIVFGGDEIGDELLFDENVIVDISRTGSSETKALIMGILTMRLNEHRMCSACANSPLRHVTLLEEAHNLLRAQNAGSVEGANIRAASVEMITNAIAEMRTYGEGFIIADQSPGILDRSVIRNTQTKVVFMLPERQDREIVGDAISLNESQKMELARLSTGVAAVFQNGWTSTVLTKINYFHTDKYGPFQFKPTVTVDEIRDLRSQFVAVLLSNHVPESRSSISKKVIQELTKKDYSSWGTVATRAQKMLQDYLQHDWIPEKGSELKLILSVLPLDRIIHAAGTEHGSEQVKRWYKRIQNELSAYLSLTGTEFFVLVNCGIHYYYPDIAKEKQKFQILFQAYCRPERT